MSQTSPRAPRKAIVLAAGLGKRMLPITATMPKPLVKVGGRSLIDFALDKLHEAGIETVVVNVHHFADMLEAHLRTRETPRIVISDERAELLETGGGVRKALPLLGDEPFITFNSDSLWIEGSEPNLKRLVRAWDPERMDILMLVAPLSTSIGFEGRGDFHRHEDGRLRRRGSDDSAPFAYAGVAIVKPELVQGTPDGAFSANAFYDRAIARDRLYGLCMEGQWLHVGEPQAIAEAERCLAASKQ
ncbi:nucleotidyltransferase family protein [Microvirga arsenatis]|uniref:NTP transferase domain-containing protein n=1 Tax=Microvirga arsenatis TaxID=2692265 RepID=A0ABW9YU28_9HYPH|nr:nucleotidyltransferase family protein [Microvirga arsenatis]NBJ09526.1 NTP transferase domain-containing protein [Microvirga arsenatis]NBJ23615.1 NTP transferase domain-containing protein [Microvirga arsenatis]